MKKDDPVKEKKVVWVKKDIAPNTLSFLKKLARRSRGFPLMGLILVGEGPKGGLMSSELWMR